MPNQLSIRSYSRQPRSHSHTHHQLVLPLRGVINIEVTGYKGKVAPGECVVIKQGEEHLFSSNTEARFVVADMDNLPDNLMASTQVVLAINAPLISYLNFIEQQLQHRVNNALEAAVFQTFYLLLSEQTLTPLMDARVGSALVFIQQHLAESLSIGALAKVACLSDTQFKKLFRQHLGITVMEYVTKQRMEKAQALLQHTDYPIQIIAEQVGYQDVSAFSRRFSRHFGLTPSQCCR